MPKATTRQKAALLKALSIQHPRRETMLGIVRRMDVLLKVFRSHTEYAGLIPFCETYRLIVRDIMLIPEESPKRFKHIKTLDRLNVDFILYYFRALQHFIATGKAPRPWQAYFRYCHVPNGSPLLQMLLGVNAHINGDFPHALVRTRYADRGDFLLMNHLLEDEVPTVMRVLALTENDHLAFGGMIFKQFAREQFHLIVTRWRLEAWRSGQALKQKKLTSAHLTAATEMIGQRLIDIFDGGSALHLLASDLPIVHKLSVKTALSRRVVRS